MELLDFGIYTVEKEYVRRLHEADCEVYFDEHGYERKPYAGIMIFSERFNYFIPLTSAKKKHAEWNLISKDTYTNNHLTYGQNTVSIIRPLCVKLPCKAASLAAVVFLDWTYSIHRLYP